MVRLRDRLAEREKNNLEQFKKSLESEGFKIEIVPGHEKSIREKCGNGIFGQARVALLSFQHRQYKLVFEEGKPAARPSGELGWVVANLAHPADLKKLIPEAIKQA